MITALTILFAVGISKWAIAPVIIAAGISALSSLAGMGISAAQNKNAANARDRYLRQSRQEEGNWYNRNYYADPTQRADAQRLINQVSEELKNRNRATAGRAAMGGATEEAVAQEKALGNQTLADVVGDIAASNSARKDKIDEAHHSNVQNINDAEFNMQQAEAARRAQNIQTAMQTAGSLGAAIAGSSADDSTAPTETPMTTPADTATPVATPATGSTDAATQLNTTPPDPKSASVENRLNQMNKIY